MWVLSTKVQETEVPSKASGTHATTIQELGLSSICIAEGNERSVRRIVALRQVRNAGPIPGIGGFGAFFLINQETRVEILVTRFYPPLATFHEDPGPFWEGCI